MNSIAPIPVSGYERQKSRSSRFLVIDTNTIMATVYAPIQWVVPDYLPEGLSVLAGRQKLGKTWLALDMAIAVATGGVAMGSICCEVGDVLYIDLENGHRRIQGRINMLFSGECNRPNLSRLGWVNDAPDLNKGFVDALEDWRSSVAEPRLVVIDVLQRIKPAGKMGQTSYESDYDAMSALQRWAMERRVGVLCLHHTRKGGADDPLEALSGSNGLSACADTTLLLDRDGNGTTLYVRGRDVEERESALTFASGFWVLTGDAADVRRSKVRSVILEFFRNNPIACTPNELAAELGWKPNNTKQLLFQMARKGELVREKGRYSLTPHNSDNPITEVD
jgi:hypothetical protein